MVTALLLSLGVAGNGHAQTQPQAVDPATVLDDRWSITPMGGFIFSDQNDLDSGFSLGIMAAKPLNAYFSYEFGADFGLLETSNAGDYERFSGRLGAVLHPFSPYFDDSAAFQPFMSGGAHLSSVDFLNQTVSAFGLYGTVGFTQRMSDRLGLTLLARYQVDDVGDSGLIQDQTYYTWQVMGGLRIAIGSKPSDKFRDSDGDGVPDHLDQCPGTPPGVQVDERGCPLDSDGDGVPDYLDKCPDTPRGVKVDADGCPTTDSDGDGTPDYRDLCPDSPPGIPVDADGCPLDSDGDGIPDYLDECPNTPAGLAVLPDGCALVGDCRRPRPGEEVDENGCAIGGFILRGVKFEFDSAILTQDARRILTVVAKTLKAYPNVTVEVAGHTDSIGTAGYNLGLSERRSLSVKQFLIGQGVNGDKLIPVGYGLTRPIADNATEEGREENRRVELVPKR